MKEYLVKVEVKLKPVVLDPQGKTVLSSLHHLGFNEVEDCRVGKLIELRLSDTSLSEIEKRVDEMCKKLLSNPVIETYSISYIEINDNA